MYCKGLSCFVYTSSASNRARGRVLVAHQPEKLHPDPPCRPVSLPPGRPTAARIISRVSLVRRVRRGTRSLVVVRDPAASASVCRDAGGGEDSRPRTSSGCRKRRRSRSPPDRPPRGGRPPSAATAGFQEGVHD